MNSAALGAQPTIEDVDAATRDLVQLSLVEGVGPRTLHALVAHFGGATAVLAASGAALREVPGVGARISAAILRARDEIDVQAELAACRQRGVRILTQAQGQYPARLLEIVDPPAVLFARGTVEPRDALAVAIVGSRHATRYGARQAERLAGGLARAGFTIVSGLARGIDGVAHRAALEAGGRTLAVLGSGVGNVYPPEHRELGEQVAAAGALLSELPVLAPPTSGAFPQRNRLISGLSLAVIVVEASDRSGALITARHAGEQGRDVLAVPGPVDSRMSHGCHRLIRDGATLIESVDDVIESLGPLPLPAVTAAGEEIHHPAELQLNEQERRVLDAIGSEATAIDAVIAAAELPAQQVLATLSVLEMRRLVARVSGQFVARV